MEENLPPGFRFHPTDEELITYYLTQKVSDSTFTSKAIGVVDLNKCEPWDLPGKASMGEKEWYFFSLRDRKYPTGLRTNRATEAGYWKTTGKDKEIYKGGHHHVLVGMKKTLVFYKGRAPRGEKSNWVMHEYRLHNKYLFKPSKEEWVVCRVFHKNSTISMKKPQQAAPSTTHELSTESQCDTNSIANELGDIELPNLNNMTNSTSGLSHNISTQSYNSLHNDNNNDNNNNNLNSMSLLNMNWDANTSSNNLQTHSSWPSSLLNPSFSVNSLLLLKALQLRSSSNYSNQLPRDNATTGTIDYSSYNNNMIQENIISPFGQDLSSTSQASSSKINNDILVDTMPQHQQDQPPFNYESIW